MSSNCENIIKNKFTNHFDWDKIDGNRVIAIGNMINCNGEILYDESTNNELQFIVKKYNIKKYKIYPISSKHVKASVLSLDDENYNKLKNNIMG